MNRDWPVADGNKPASEPPGVRDGDGDDDDDDRCGDDDWQQISAKRASWTSEQALDKADSTTQTLTA